MLLLARFAHAQQKPTHAHVKMSRKHTYAEIANSFELWQEYADPQGVMSREEFDAMSHGLRVFAQVEAFGPEDLVPTVADLLAEQRVWRRPYRVTFTHRVVTVMVRTHPEAIRSAQELAGPGARLLSCLQEGEW
jgi:hypothetical protein